MNKKAEKSSRYLLISSLLIFVGIAIIALFFPLVTYGFLTWLFGGPLNDQQLIDDKFSSRLGVFSNIEILNREAGANGRYDSRTLTLQLTINGYPNSIQCQSKLHYIHGDPSFVGVTWSDPACEAQYQLVGSAQFILENSYPQGPLPSGADAIAQILKRGIEEHRITLSDIKNPDMQNKVNQLLEIQ